MSHQARAQQCQQRQRHRKCAEVLLTAAPLALFPRALSARVHHLFRARGQRAHIVALLWPNRWSVARDSQLSALYDATIVCTVGMAVVLPSIS